MRPHPPILVHIGIGANLGDRETTIRTALDMLDMSEGVSVARISKLIENPAVGGPPDAPPFLNAAAELRTVLGAHALLHKLLDIEHQLGRNRRIKWEPRPIDLDLLLYGNQILSSNELVVPHPLMHERRFVLQPLAEIAGQVVHPVLQMSIQGLLESLKKC